MSFWNDEVQRVLGWTMIYNNVSYNFVPRGHFFKIKGTCLKNENYFIYIHTIKRHSIDFFYKCTIAAKNTWKIDHLTIVNFQQISLKETTYVPNFIIFYGQYITTYRMCIRKHAEHQAA